METTQREAFDEALRWVDANEAIIVALRAHPETLVDGVLPVTEPRGLFGRLFAKSPPRRRPRPTSRPERPPLGEERRGASPHRGDEGARGRGAPRALAAPAGRLARHAAPAPVLPSDEIELYVRTYSSLLRSSGEVRVRAFEEAHSFSASSLHEGALSLEPDISAFAYAAARLPEETPELRRVVLGQSHELFEAARASTFETGRS